MGPHQASKSSCRVAGPPWLIALATEVWVVPHTWGLDQASADETGTEVPARCAAPPHPRGSCKPHPAPHPPPSIGQGEWLEARLFLLPPIGARGCGGRWGWGGAFGHAVAAGFGCSCGDPKPSLFGGLGTRKLDSWAWISPVPRTNDGSPPLGLPHTWLLRTPPGDPHPLTREDPPRLP